MTRLTEKLNLYSNKQKLLDQTSELLKSKEAEIVGLREKLVCLEAAKAKSSARPGVPAHASRGHTRKVQQLEKQVKELEQVIRKKFPNSLSALILAANSSTELELENRYVCPFIMYLYTQPFP